MWGRSLSQGQQGLIMNCSWCWGFWILCYRQDDWKSWEQYTQWSDFCFRLLSLQTAEKQVLRGAKMAASGLWQWARRGALHPCDRREGRRLWHSFWKSVLGWDVKGKTKGREPSCEMATKESRASEEPAEGTLGKEAETSPCTWGSETLWLQQVRAIRNLHLLKYV